MSERKVALVTGSATGIGRAVALRFAREGLAVAVNYSRSQSEAEETLAEVKKLGIPGILCKANVADEGQVKAMVERCVKELGGLDVLVNNAGTTRFIDHTDLAAATSEVWDEIFGVNVKGSFFCCREALPHLEESGGTIVNVTDRRVTLKLGDSVRVECLRSAITGLESESRADADSA